MTSDELFKPQELPKDQKHLFVFDDVMIEKKPLISEYFCRGRHNNCNMFFLAQNYFYVPRQTFRENCILFILFIQKEASLKLIYKDLFDYRDEFTFEEFREICYQAWMTKYNYIVIDLDNECFKLRENWNKVWFKGFPNDS